MTTLQVNQDKKLAFLDHRKPLSAPLKVELILTDRCNLKCLHCGVSEISYSEPELNFDGWLKVIRKLAEAKVFFVHLNGGEIFILPYIFELMEVIQGQKLKIKQLNTNATLLTENKVKRLAAILKSPFSVLVSLDGYNPRTHDVLRGKGVFDKTIRGIKLLQENGIIPKLVCVVNKFNYNVLPKIIDKALDLGAKSISIKELNLVGRACEHRDLKPDKLNYIQAAKDVEKMKKVVPENFIRGPFSDLATMITRGDSYFRPKGEMEKAGYLSGCGIGLNACVIGPTGRLAVCDVCLALSGESVVANNRPFIEIWKESKILKRGREIFNIPLSQVEECNKCINQNMCKGMCVGVGAVKHHSWPYIDSIDCIFFKKKGDEQ
jgi:radical SAM protein with 4Fe4S-binding SPASM domain